MHRLIYNFKNRRWCTNFVVVVQKTKKMSVEQVKQYIDTVSNDLVARLGEAVAIPSVSSDLISHGKDCVRMGEYVAHWIERLGGTVHYVTPEKHHPEDPELPPIILGSLGNDHSKPTVALYGHYDVQPANQADGWATDPWKLTEKDGKLFGRGSTDDKGNGKFLGLVFLIGGF
jgi:acetylornithine deacetylase/succinyl-diaminopimelate desuccinylase-like protein